MCTHAGSQQFIFHLLYISSTKDPRAKHIISVGLLGTTHSKIGTGQKKRVQNTVSFLPCMFPFGMIELHFFFHLQQVYTTTF